MTAAKDNASSLQQPSRRQFLLELGAAAAVAATPPVLAQIPATSKLLLRPIPSSGELLPVLGLGTARTFNVEPGSARLDELREVLRRFYELGGRMIDSSPMYGHAEALTGMMARQLGITDDLFFATKVWTEGESEGARQMDTSAKHFQTDTIDLMQVHNLVDLQTQLRSIRARLDQGRVRYLGVSHYRDDMHETIADLLLREPIDFLQINYSIVSRNAEKRLLGVAADQGVAIIVNQAFERGRLFRKIDDQQIPPWLADLGVVTWAQYMLKFVLSHPAVNTVIPAADKVAYVDDNMQAGHGPMPDTRTRERMAKHFNTLI